MLRIAAICTCFALLLAGQSGTSFSWKPATQDFAAGHGGVDLVLGAPLPRHWAVTVIARDGARGRVSAGSVDLDGLFIERVTNLDAARLQVKPGEIRIEPVVDEPGLAICISVPAGMKVRVLQQATVITTAEAGAVIQDGAVIGRDAGVCASLPALQTAIAR